MPSKFLIGSIIATIVILFGGVFLVSKIGNTPQLEVAQEASLSIEETSHTWGDIGINDGNVQKTFIIKNSGPGTLELANIATSCMCTTAQVIIDGKPSPHFGMHSKSGWVGEVSPNGEAELIVEFDPAFHGPSGVGQITRQINLETNDANQPKLTFNLTANVIN